MKIRNREVKFLRTVEATCEIASLCPDKDIERIDELFSGNLPTTLETGAKIIHYLNKGYEKNKSFDDPNYVPNPISLEEIMCLDDKTFTALMQSAMQGMGVGAETTVETEKDTKKKEKENQE